MKKTIKIIAALWVVAFSFAVGGLVGSITAQPRQPQHAVCLQSHREVVMIPTICGTHDICQKPVVTDVCDRIQAPPPRPICQGGDN